MLIVTLLVYKVTLALTLAGHPLLQPVGELDSGEYWRLAQRVAGGDVLLAGTPFYVSPLYIYVLAALQTATGGSLAGVLVAQALLGTLAVVLVWQTTAWWSDGRAGLVAATLVAATGILALQEVAVLQSAIDPLLVAGLLAAFTRALQRGRGSDWAWCGALLAAFALNRPNAWLLAPLCLLAASSRGTRRPRAVAAMLAGLVLVVTPFALRTAYATGAWQVLPGHGGLNLYIGNHAGATGTYTVVDGVRPSMDGQREDTRRLAEAAEGRRLSDAEVSAYFAGRAMDWWQTSPVAALRLTAYKLWLSIHAWELPVNLSYAWFREQVWLLWLLPVGAWLLLPLAAAAIVAGSAALPPARRDGWGWLCGLLPLYLVSVAFTFVVDRYRAPALVIAAVIAAPLLAGLVSDRARVRLGAWRGRAATVVAAALLLSALVPLPFHLGQGDADVRMAMQSIAAGRDAAAWTWLTRAAAHGPEPSVGFFRAGLAWQAKADWSNSARALQEAHRRDPEVAEIAFALAGSLLSQGKGAEAVPLLRQAAAAGVHPDRVGLDLALALWQAGDEPAARAALADALPGADRALLRARALAAVDARQTRLAESLLEASLTVAPGDAEVTEKLGLMLAAQRRWDAAATRFEAAAALDATRATARFNLALVRLQQGRRDEAVALLHEALRIDPDYVQAIGALQELGSLPPSR